MINIIEKLNNFFTVDLQENPEGIFHVLNDIIPFQSGYIYYMEPERLVYSFNPQKHACELKADLKIKNTPFGILVISRETPFSADEQKVFNACTSIIANLIKDIEISQILNMQISALHEGIKETNIAYKSARLQNEFFANFSHELRTPLNSIISSSELLSEKIFGELNEKQSEYINDIRIAALHLLGMINDILDMAKIEAKSMKLNKTEFHLTQSIEEVCNIIKPLALKKSITLEKKFTSNDIINADYAKIQQIIFNLLTNAIKYTQDNGKIELSVKKDKNKILFSVKDNGIGIEQKNLKRIFKKFVKLGNEKDSNGLGLTITSELVKLHKGKIEVKSELSKGSTFTVVLPA